VIVSLKDEYEDFDNLKLKNDESESNVDNLISLPYLHEPAILFCLEKRYSQGDIYTYTGQGCHNYHHHYHHHYYYYHHLCIDCKFDHLRYISINHDHLLTQHCITLQVPY